MSQIPPITFATRFRGFLPVVVDVETGGFNSHTDALLEIAAVFVEMRSDGTLARGETFRYHVVPFPGANMEPASLAVNGIDPHHPLRPAIKEEDALQRIFGEVRKAIRAADCTRAVLVGHNAFFDLNFLNAAVARTQIKRNPFHPFTSFDTATLGGVAFGQTVLMRATLASGLEWDTASAHSAAYDAERTADLFCTVCNQFQSVFDTSRRRLASMGPLEVDTEGSSEPGVPRASGGPAGRFDPP
jgi:ribonuclease T